MDPVEIATWVVLVLIAILAVAYTAAARHVRKPKPEPKFVIRKYPTGVCRAFKNDAMLVRDDKTGLVYWTREVNPMFLSGLGNGLCSWDDAWKLITDYREQKTQEYPVGFGSKAE